MMPETEYKPMMPVTATQPAFPSANHATVDEASASPEVRALYQRFRDEFGRATVPGILQCFATHPALLRHMMELAKEMLFVDGALGRRNKELLSTFVSAGNHCSYCADSHGHAFRLQGGTEAAVTDLIACNADAGSLTPEERILLHFAKKISDNSQAIGPADMEAMRVAGFSDLQIAEAIHVTALFATFNRVVNAFGLPSQHLLDSFNTEGT